MPRLDLNKYAPSAATLILIAATAYAAQPITEITLPGTRIFPESISSTPDGTLIVGSLGHGNVSRIALGTAQVEEWIKAGTGGLNQVLGVYADPKGKTLWVCSNNLQNKGEATAAMAPPTSPTPAKAAWTC
jgi:DNA-binding beta-propeller fold protein YncE